MFLINVVLFFLLSSIYLLIFCKNIEGKAVCRITFSALSWDNSPSLLVHVSDFFFTMRFSLAKRRYYRKAINQTRIHVVTIMKYNYRTNDRLYEIRSHVILGTLQVQSSDAGTSGGAMELKVPQPTHRRRRAKLTRSVSERSDSDSSGIADIDCKSTNGQVSCSTASLALVLSNSVCLT